MNNPIFFKFYLFTAFLIEYPRNEAQNLLHVFKNFGLSII